MAATKPNKALLFLIIFAFYLSNYWSAYDAGFVSDFTGLYNKMNHGTWLGAVKSFGFPSLMPVLNLLYYTLFKLFNLHALAWFVFFILVQSLGCFYWLKWLEFIQEKHALAKDRGWILFALFLYVFSPYAVEAIVWKVGLGHLSSVSLFITALYFAHKYPTKWSGLLIMTFGIILSLLCFEWAIVFPIFILTISIVEKNYTRYKLALISSTSVVLLFLLANKWVLKAWVGHYPNQLDSFSIINALATFPSYLAKHLLFMPFWSSTLKNQVYDLIQGNLFVIGFCFLGISLFVFSHFKVKKLQNRWIWAMIFLSAAALILVSPLYFSRSVSENDRYASLMLPFFCSFLALILYRFRIVYIDNWEFNILPK